MIHKDKRRTLIEWSSGKPFVVSKVVIAEEDCVVGDHHHDLKEEEFFLLSGRLKRVVIGERESLDVPPLTSFQVPAGTYHLFEMEKGSVLLGTATKPYDETDEIRGK